MNGATWQEQTLAELRHARQQRKQAEEELAYWTEYSETLEKLVTVQGRRRAIKVTGQQSVDPEALRTKSVREALIEIAARNNGLLVVRDAVDVLIQAKVYENRDQARNTIYSTLYYGKAYFQRERPGIYRLTDRGQAQLALPA